MAPPSESASARSRSAPPSARRRGPLTAAGIPTAITHRRQIERRRDGIEVETATWTRLRVLADEYQLTDRLGLGDVE